MKDLLMNVNAVVTTHLAAWVLLDHLPYILAHGFTKVYDFPDK